MSTSKVSNRKSGATIRSTNVVSQRRIVLALRKIQRQRKTNLGRALYGAEQALGWAAGMDYMNPASLWGD